MLWTPWTVAGWTPASRASSPGSAATGSEPAVPGTPRRDPAVPRQRTFRVRLRRKLRGTWAGRPFLLHLQHLRPYLASAGRPRRPDGAGRFRTLRPRSFG